MDQPGPHATPTPTSVAAKSMQMSSARATPRPWKQVSVAALPGLRGLRWGTSRRCDGPGRDRSGQEETRTPAFTQSSLAGGDPLKSESTCILQQHCFMCCCEVKQWVGVVWALTKTAMLFNSALKRWNAWDGRSGAKIWISTAAPLKVSPWAGLVSILTEGEAHLRPPCLTGISGEI